MSLRRLLTLTLAIAPLACSRSEAKELNKGRPVSATARASAPAAPPVARFDSAGAGARDE